MKKNNFAEEIKNYKEIDARFAAAGKAKDQAGAEAARADFQVLQKSIEGKGETYARVFEAYRDMDVRGNSYIDLDRVIWDSNVAKVVDGLRECGVEYFVFSSGWSSAVETAWLFLQNGCTLEGMVEINDSPTSFGSKEFDKKHGYLFRVGEARGC